MGWEEFLIEARRGGDRHSNVGIIPMEVAIYEDTLQTLSAEKRSRWQPPAPPFRLALHSISLHAYTPHKLVLQ